MTHKCTVCGEEHHVYGTLDMMLGTVAKVAIRRLKLLKRCDRWIRILMDDPPFGLVEFLDELAAELED